MAGGSALRLGGGGGGGGGHAALPAVAVAVAAAVADGTPQAVAQCKLIQGEFATMLQIFLGLLSMGTLLFKRYVHEDNPRPYEVWLMDVSKQSVQSVLVHSINIALSIVFASLSLTTSRPAGGDQCAFYFISFLLDTVLGVHIIWLCLRLVRFFAKWWGWSSVAVQGAYGSPPSFEVYVKQLYVFLASTVVSKLVLGFVMYGFHSPLDALGTWLFFSLRLHPQTELIFVMLIAPFFLNSVQYWVTDNILSSPSMRYDYSDLDLKTDGDLGSLLQLGPASTTSTPVSPVRGAGLDKSSSSEGVYYRVRLN